MQDSLNYYFPVMGGGGTSKPEQAKTVDITSNGTVVVTPDEGMTLSSVTVNTSVAAQSAFPQYVDGTVTEITAADLQGATTIRDYAFYQCSSLTTITIPEGVTSIGASAFYGCLSLQEITIPDTVTSIGDSAFSRCSSLTTVTIPEGVTRIGASAFSRCSSLTTVTIPDTVTRIGASALVIGSATNKATITMLSTTPPSISSSTFNASYLNQIIVPAGTGATYKSATNWANFADYIVEATT